MLEEHIRRWSSKLLLAIEDKKALEEAHPDGDTCRVNTEGWDSHLLQVMVSIKKSRINRETTQSGEQGLCGEASLPPNRVMVVARAFADTNSAEELCNSRLRGLPLFSGGAAIP